MENFNPFDKLRTSPDGYGLSKNQNQNEEIEESEKNPRKKRIIFLYFGLFIISIAISIFLIFTNKSNKKTSFINRHSSIINPTLLPSPTPTQIKIPISKLLSNGSYHIFQSFNNCGPAALSMALRFYEVNVSQEELGQALRPYQIPGGDNDDKSVTLKEIANKSEEYGFTAYLRPMGNEELVKKFIANDIPVITRTWLKKDEDIGHFRIIKGYDDSRKVFIQDDSLQGKDLEYSYSEYDEIWKKFNYEYLVLVPKEKDEIAKNIIGENINEKIAWKKAAEYSKNQLLNNPQDIDASFNLSVAYYHLGEFQKSIEDFEKVESKLSFRTLWYQIEPILSYYELKNDKKIFEITDKILNNQNRAYSELYILRGKIYKNQGNNEAAKQEFEKALFYNINLKEAQELVRNL